MAELGRLLSFMSSWDRQATLERYEDLFAQADDPAALLEELGTPTRVAIELARTYVPTPAPVREAPSEPEDAAEASPELTEAPEQIQWDLSAAAEPEPVPTKKVVRGGALAGYLVPVILIGVPVAVLLICLGLPFLAAGVGIVVAAVQHTLIVIGALTLFSDILLSVGAALAACAVGLLLAWLGLWLAMELCWLWVDKVLLALGRRLCVKEVPAV